MKKLFIVIILLLSTSVPVFSEELSDDKVLLVVDEDDKEDTLENKLIINKNSYLLEVYSSRIITYEIVGNGEVSFESLDKRIVSVNERGEMSAIAPGKTDIEVVFKPEEGEVITEEVAVEVLKDDGVIKFNKNEFYLIRDLYFDIDYSLEGGLASQELIWESSNPAVATVENGRVTGNSLGSTTITASSGDVSDQMEVHVTAPLKGLAYNPEKIEIVLGEKKDLPSLVYAPYDTTTAKIPTVSLEDTDIVALNDNVLTANKVGETKVFAQINDIVAELMVVVRPEKNERGADVITLKTESIQGEEITFENPNLSLFESNYFSIHLPIEETLDFFKEQKNLDVFIVLDDSLYANDMSNVDELIIAEEIMNKFDDRVVTVHLLNQDNVPQLVYEFKQGFPHTLDLKFSVNELEESDPLFSLVQTKAYHALFLSDQGFPEMTTVKIPAQTTGAHYKQLHFVYQVLDEELLDTNQEVTIDSQDYLNIELGGNSYLITLSKVSKVNDSKVIVTLSIILFISLIAAVSIYYYNTHYKNKKV